MLNPIYLSNKSGIPRILTSGVTVGTNNVTFTVPSNDVFANTYNGLILLKFNLTIETGTTTTLPILLTSQAGNLNITVLGGTNWTVADYTTGIHLAYYESNTGILQLIA